MMRASSSSAAATLAAAILWCSGSAALAQPAPGQQSARPAAQVAVAQEYRLGAGDVVRVNVFQNPDLSVETRITEAGVVSYPLLGNIQLGGLTVTEAERVIANGLRNGNFVKQPQVTLLVLQVRGNQVSV